jgi:hypothetical protein
MIVRRICECFTMGGRDGLQLRDQTQRLGMVQKRHSKQLWECSVKIFHKLQSGGRSRMMKIHGDLKVGIHLIEDIVDIV